MSEEVIAETPAVEKLPADRQKIALEFALVTTIEEIKDVVTSFPQSRDYTNFSLTYDSFTLEDVLTLEDLIGRHELQDVTELTLHLKEDAYTESSVRAHVLKTREFVGLKSNIAEFSGGVSAGVSKFQDLQLGAIEPGSGADAAQDAETESQEFGPEEKPKVSAVVGQILKHQDVASHAAVQKVSVQPALKSLAVSVWNPPSWKQALKGDLMYLQAQTLEGDTYQITAHVSGFFVNGSSSAHFDGSARHLAGHPAGCKSHSLLKLLTTLSSKLEEQIQRNMDYYLTTEPEVYLPAGNTFLSNSWLVQDVQPTYPDVARSQLNYLVGGPDGADLSKDWNDEFQNIRELPKATFSERVMRERLLNRTGYEFSAAAASTAVAIVRGELEPMNPEAAPSLHVFLRNGIFYSFGVDAADAFKNSGGNEAARAAAVKDLASLRLLNKIDAQGVCHILTAVVDYCGKRVVCQAPVPGIFNDDDAAASDGTSEAAGAPAPADSQNKVAYGLTGSGNLVVEDGFKAKFAPIGAALHLKPHKGWSSTGADANDVVTSVETKGLRGTDGRDYIIDLYRTAPLDIEFIEQHWAPGQPRSYPHREVTLRHEALDEWRRRQIAVAVKRETDRLDSEESKTGSPADPTAESQAEKHDITVDSSDFALNPDAFSLDASVAAEQDLAELRADEAKVRETSKFVTLQLIPEFIQDVADSKVMVPIDGKHLAGLLHKRGINLRYLGHLAAEILKAKDQLKLKESAAREEILKANETYLAEQASKAEEADVAKDDKKDEEEASKADFTPSAFALETLYHIAVQEMVARGAKHVLRDYTSTLPLVLVPACVAHFHNCLLGEALNAAPVAEVDPALKTLYLDTDFSFTKLTPSQVASLVADEVYIRFRFELQEGWKQNQVRNVPLLREIANQFGIQWKSRGYAFTEAELSQVAAQEPAAPAAKSSSAKGKKKNKKSAAAAPVAPSAAVTTTSQVVTFTPDDIVSLYPVVKDSAYMSTLVGEIWAAGSARIRSEEERESGLSLLREAVQFYEQIYGNIHPQVSKAYAVLGETYHDLDLLSEACALARKAVLISERTYGLDSSDTILALINSAFFEHANGNVVGALDIYSRALADWKVVFGESHPSLVTLLTNVASLLQKKKAYKEAALVCEYAVQISEKSNGADSQITGMLNYQLGQYFFMAEEIDSALSALEKAYAVFKISVGESDVITRDSKKWVDSLTSAKNNRAELLTRATAEAAKNSKSKKAVKAPVQPENSKAKSKKSKHKALEPLPDIASKTLDELTAFVEGHLPQRKAKK